MASPARSTAWSLTPEQLVSACALLGIEELPGDLPVGAAGRNAPFLVETGRRSLEVARLVTQHSGVPVLDPSLAQALAHLNDPAADFAASLWLGDGSRQHVIATADLAAALERSPDEHAFELFAGSLEEAATRTALALGAVHGSGIVGEAAPGATEEILAPDRWERLSAGGAVRRTDGPLAARAAAAAAARGVWQATWLGTVDEAGSAVEGYAATWVVDDAGAITIEEGAADAGEDGALTTVLRAAPPFEAPLPALWGLGG